MVAELVSSSLDKHIWTWRNYTIAYTVMGKGQPLVLIHGFGASLGHWRKNIPVLAEAGYQVYALDLLGFGGSDQPPLDYSLDLWQDLLRDFWAEFIQTPAVYIGNSIGGLLTLMMLANHPETATAGAVLNCAGGLNHRPEELRPPLNWVMGTFTRVVSSELLGPIVFSQVRRKHRIELNSALFPRLLHPDWPGAFRFRGWYHLPELGQVLAPVLQNPFCFRTAGVGYVGFNQPFQLSFARRGNHPLHFDDFGVDFGGEAAVLIQHVGQTTGHPGTDVAANAAQHHHDAAGHVFAAVVTGPFNHRLAFRVPHGEPLPSNAVGVEGAAG
jgi:pimeloyl-ACP methyl ester carboxylesterase